MSDNRKKFEAAVVDRLKQSGFLEIEIRTECLVRSDDGYQDEVINAGWHYWNAALVSAGKATSAPMLMLDMSADELAELQVLAARAPGDIIPVQPPPPSSHVAGDDSPRYSMKRMRDEITRAKAYARREALSDAATKAHSLIAADYIANSVRDQILAIDGSGPWLPIDQADTSTDRIYDLPGMPSPIANSEEYWCRDADGRVFQAAWADDGKRAYWWDLDGESPVDPIEFMPHPLDPRWATTTEGQDNG